MITKMKKLTFLIYHKEYETFLQRIRELGVVHIVEKQCGELDEDMQRFVQKKALYKTMLAEMYRLVDGQPDDKVLKDTDADTLVRTYEELQSHVQNLNMQLPLVEKEISQMEVWGDFDWQLLDSLSKAGWYPLWERAGSCLLLFGNRMSRRGSARKARIRQVFRVLIVCPSAPAFL